MSTQPKWVNDKQQHDQTPKHVNNQVTGKVMRHIFFFLFVVKRNSCEDPLCSFRSQRLLICFLLLNYRVANERLTKYETNVERVHSISEGYVKENP